MEINVKCKVEERVSKLGKKYKVLIIEDLGKFVFLNETEYKLINLIDNNRIKNSK